MRPDFSLHRLILSNFDLLPFSRNGWLLITQEYKDQFGRLQFIDDAPPLTQILEDGSLSYFSRSAARFREKDLHLA